MAAKAVTTTTWECDFKCGETTDTTGSSQLNHAHVPHGWEKVYRVPSGYMTTDDDKAKVGYVLCPACYRLFEILAMGEKTGMGARFRMFTKAFWENEKVLNELPKPNRDAEYIMGALGHEIPGSQEDLKNQYDGVTGVNYGV